jgi:thioredoxin-related protein
MRRICVGLLFGLYGSLAIQPAIAQETTQQEKINWLTWEQATEVAKKSKKKILLDVYTEWCTWCKRMDEKTFQQPEIARYINANFYPVKFDAEQKQNLEYKDRVYKYIKTSNKGYHELAAELLKGRLSFPSVVFLDEDMNIIQAIPGFKSPEEFEQIVTYFAKDHYKTTPWSAFIKSYKPILVSEKH